jgi:peptide/nickel transport system permease protein
VPELGQGPSFLDKVAQVFGRENKGMKA